MGNDDRRITVSGIPRKPFYTAKDLAPSGAPGASEEPGPYPFALGIRSQQARCRSREAGAG